MIHQMSRSITRSLIKNDIINFDDVTVYQYGLEVLLMTVIKFIGIAIFAMLTGYITETVLFVIAFGSIRTYAGGYHAGSVFKCFLLTIAFLCLDIYACSFFNIQSSPQLSVILAGMTWFIVYRYAPVEVVTRPISERERKIFRRKSIFLASFYFLIVALGSVVGNLSWHIGVFSMALFIESLTLVVEIMRKEIVG